MRAIDADDLRIKAEQSMISNNHTEGKVRFNHTTEHQHFLNMILLQPTVNQWIPCSERFPEAEKEVELSIKRITDDKTYYFTVRGFYEDGSVWNDQSFCNWEYDKTVHEYDEEQEDFKIPEGWWELSTYADENDVYLIDDFVTAWRELPEPYKGEE